MDWHFEACLNKNQTVYPVFYKFLEKMHTKEQLECIDTISDFKADPTEEKAKYILTTFIDQNSPKEINLEHFVRQDVQQRVKDSLPNPPSTVFNSLEDTLSFQLKSSVYDVFTNSTEFKVWISSRYMNEMMDTMNELLADFGKEETEAMKRGGCLGLLHG